MDSRNQSIRVSVIIPCFNDGGFLEEAIASVETCPDPIYEIIVVNDGSTDPSTLNILRDLTSKGYKVINQQNRGPGAARNTGIRQAQGEYILPLDADNRIRPAYIYRGIEILDRYPDVAVAYSDVDHFGEKTGAKQIPDFCLSSLVVDNYIDNCAVFRKSAWAQCGFYDEEMPYYGQEDWDLWLSIAKKGFRFYHIPEVLFEYRVRADSMIQQFNEAKIRVMSRYLASKHAALFPKEYRYYLKPYRGWIKIREAWRSLLKRRTLNID